MPTFDCANSVNEIRILNRQGGCLALALIASFAISSPVQAQVVTEYTLTNRPDTMLPVPGPDGNIWFADGGGFAKSTTGGVVTEYYNSTSEQGQNNANIGGMHGITIGPDGGMWSFNTAACYLDTIGTNGAIGVPQFYQSCGTPPTAAFGEIVTGPDGFLWYTSLFGVRRMDVSGNYTTFALTGNGHNDAPIAIAVGGDGALWATSHARLIYRFTTSGMQTFYTIPWGAAGGCVGLVDIALGPDSEMWFTDACASSIGRVTTQGVFTQFVVPNGGFPRGIINGPDNALYFTDSGNNAVGRLGAGGVFSFYPAITPGSTPWGIAVEADHNIWFTENTNPNGATFPGKIAKLDLQVLLSKRNETHDLNGDGYSDIIWRDTSGTVAPWLMNGASAAAAAAIGTVPNTWSIVGQRDFNGDHDADLLWRDTNGNTAIWFMNGTQVSSTATVGNIPNTFAVVATADFNGDGKADILWRDSSGNTSIWLMNGATVSSAGGLGNIPATWSVAGTGDFNGDGFADILWRDNQGNTAVWFMSGTTVSSAGVIGNIPTTWLVAGIGDFNGDGMSDMVWRDGSGDTSIWLMNGTSVLSAGGLGNIPAPMWSIVQTGDYDGNGTSDLMWRDTNGNTAIWFMNGATVSSSAGVGNIPTTWTVQSVNAE
jgi:streptogramin lyase